MSNYAHPNFLDGLGKKQIDLVNDVIKVSLLGTGYTFDTGHDTFADLTDVLVTATLTGKTVDNGGVFRAENLGPLSVMLEEIQAAWIWDDSVGDMLMLYVDGDEGFHRTPAGDVYIRFNQAETSGIFPIGGMANP